MVQHCSGSASGISITKLTWVKCKPVAEAMTPHHESPLFDPYYTLAWEETLMQTEQRISLLQAPRNPTNYRFHTPHFPLELSLTNKTNINLISPNQKQKQEKMKWNRRASATPSKTSVLKGRPDSTSYNMLAARLWDTVWWLVAVKINWTFKTSGWNL